jgi:hypothetical protein
VTYPVKGLHYGPALAVTLWTQAGTASGSIPGNQARAGSVVLGSFINIVTGLGSSRDDCSLAGFALPDSTASSLGYGDVS